MSTKSKKSKTRRRTTKAARKDKQRKKAATTARSGKNTYAGQIDGSLRDGSKDSPAPKKMPIVAIGASAGGLEALKSFFARVPAKTGIGFVVITHTSPECPSLLPDLLSDSSKIPAVTGESGARVVPNKIIVAKDTHLTIAGGVLFQAEEHGPPPASHHPIDRFFRSLAVDQQEHAICVVLSGSGNDGTLGLRAIKAAGGMVMVQTPETARYPDMPHSAQATGLADYVLPPEDLCDALVAYCQGPFLRLISRPEIPILPEETIRAILVRLRTHSGQDFTSYKLSTMSRRIQRRMNVNHIEEPDLYLRALRDNPKELDALLSELLISVTSFFRDPKAWEALAKKALPHLFEDRDEGQPIRAWVPGCATGEEAYTLAILLEELIRKEDCQTAVQIFASDADAQAIDVARGGLYSKGIASDVSAARLKRYFMKEDSAYRVSKNIRDMIVFAVQNAISDPPFTRMDLIVCRNLLIYLNSSAQQRVLPLFHYALRPGGFLFLGASETVGEASQTFEAIDNKNKIYKRKSGRSPVQLSSALSIHSHGEEIEPQEKYSMAARGGTRLSRNIERLLLERFAPCSIVVDDRDGVLYLHGRGGLYFEPEQGQPHNNAVSMARKGLRPALVKSLRQARNQRGEVTTRSIGVQTNGETTRVDLTVRQLTTPPSLRGLLLITLQPSVATSQAPVDAEPAIPLHPAEREDLERELQYTRESLQSTIEELEASNEELKSTNEELQSTNEELHSSNEELETSKEEMQSLNEELNTVNTELQSKVGALARANDDLTNVLNSMQVAAIFLDRELRVTRYTEQAKELIRLIESDIGRPLSDLTRSLRYDDLTKDCRKVLATLVPYEKEVRDDRGHWYLARMMPYRSSDNVIDGLVITVLDIERVKQAEADSAALKTKGEFFRSIVQTVRDALLVLDDELKVVLANESFHRKFRTRPEEIDGQPFWMASNGAWDVPELRDLLERSLPGEEVVTDFRIEHDFPWIGRRVFVANARRPGELDGDSALVLLAFEDVTPEKGHE